MSISNKCRTELFVPVVVGQFLSSAERFHPCPEMITGALLFSSLLLQKLSIVVYKAGPPAVFQQFKAQSFRVIAVLLHVASFSFHPCLLVAAVIGEQADPGCIFLLYYTALTVIRKLFSIGRAFLFDQLVLLIIKISGFSLSIRLPDSVSGFVIGIANRSAVPPLFQKLSTDIIIVGEIQRIIPCGDAAQSCLCACLRRTVSVAVIPVCKGEQDIFARSGFQSADVTVTIVGTGGLHTIAITDMADAVQGIVAVAHFQSVIIKDAASSAQNVILIPGADSCGIPDLRDLPCPVMGIGN